MTPLLCALAPAVAFLIGYFLGRRDAELDAEANDLNRRMRVAVESLRPAETEETELVRDCVFAKRKRGKRARRTS